MAGGLVRFGQRYRREAVPVMRASQGRVHATASAGTPVGKTGRMRASLRQEPTDDGFGYTVGWVATDFPSGGKQYTYRTSTAVLASSAVPNVPAGFYPGFVVLGTRFMAGRDPLSPALEVERPLLVRELVGAAHRAARG